MITTCNISGIIILTNRLLQYRSSDVDRFRAAIKERADSLGIQEASKESILEAEERAKAAIANRGDGVGQMGQMLDLTQITDSAPRGDGEDEESMVADIFYEPEDEMTEEEMKEADPTGQLSIPEWMSYEFGTITWPTPFAALKEVLILLVAIALTGGLIVGTDTFLRTAYTDLGLIPRPEEIMQAGENLVLPDGWTDGMSDADFMKYQDEAASSAASNTFQDL